MAFDSFFYLVGYVYNDAVKPIYFISSVMREELFDNLFRKEKKPGHQIQKFNRLIVEGIQKNNREIICYSAVTVSKQLLNQTFLKLENDSLYHYGRIVNISGFKNIYNFLAAFFSSLVREKGYYLIDPLSFDNALGTVLANRITGCKSVSIVTDLPEFMSTSSAYIKAVNRVLSLSDGYVFLTKALNEHVNKKQKPWILMEGLVDCSIEENTVETRDKKMIYAGTLNERNGVKNLIEAYLKAGDFEYTLHFYGNGSFEEEMKEVCKRYPTIFYHGSIPNQELMETMKQASLLINPRPADQDFTKYSFPSKTIEYLSTGTYSACTRLPGIPAEYFQYIGDLGMGSADEIAEFLKRFYAMSEDERNQKAKEGFRFVKQEKNNVKQAGRILALLNEVTR